MHSASCIFKVIMVLSWRAKSPFAAMSERQFTDDGNVKMFFFFPENVAMRGKDDAEKASENLSHLDEDALSFFFDRLTIKGATPESSTNFWVVR